MDCDFEFFNDVSGRLSVLTSGPSERLGSLENVVVDGSAGVLQVSLALQMFDEDDLRELTEGERRTVVLRAPHVRLRSSLCPDVTVDRPASDGAAFTVEELAGAIEELERHSRPHTNWFGGVDVHHVYFEGFQAQEDGAWMVLWGS